jgi:hypothetical protein
MDEFQTDLLNHIVELSRQVQDLRLSHARMMSAMMAEHRARCNLLDELLQEQRDRNQLLDRMIRESTGDSSDDWWKRGDSPPWT